ncbi:E3 ubiquitin-protein ligase CHFR-like isoform X2 [Harmonia axyridis]|uniref:E3 ubiquitin-protein ligase CHFR-like isoform X2 n=1 Tax=Harmonia axyridis TaxID=115357 RepID=UPI001E276312|nr:E3 ubiquitin-protein ligase CHFR-like isoform X2 [Harmonia axyridis]
MSASVYPCLLNLNNNVIVPITKSKFSVGRSLKSDYVLHGSSISRIHFYIEKMEDIWILRDNSTNGTLVNKDLVVSEIKILENGDLIEFIGGTFCLKYKDSNLLSELMTSQRRNSLPSVTNDHNDHSYERREAAVEQTSSVSHVAIDLTSQSRGQKRNYSEADEEPPVKKSKYMEETSDEPKLECTLEASELECSICQELYIEATTLNCAHSFCSSCIGRWRWQRDDCPMCRRPIESANPSMVLDNLVKKVLETKDEKVRKEWNEVRQDRIKGKETEWLYRLNRMAPRRRSRTPDFLTDGTFLYPTAEVIRLAVAGFVIHGVQFY